MTLELEQIKKLIEDFEVKKALQFLGQTSKRDPLHAAIINFYYAKIYYLLAENRQALEYIEKALENVKVIEKIEPAVTIDIYIEYGKILRRLKKFDEAIKIYEHLLQQKETLTDLQIAKVFNNLGNCYLELKDFKTSKMLFDNALELNLKLKDEKALSISYASLGSYYYYSGEINKAIEFFEKSYNIRKKFSQPLFLATIELNLGSVYSALFEYEKATYYLKEALNHFNTISHKRGISKTKDILSNIYLAQKKYGSIVELYPDLMENKREISPNDYNSILKLITAIIKLNQINRAEKVIINTLEKVKHHKETPQKFRFESQLKHLLANIYVEKKMDDKALEILKELEKKASKIKDKESLAAIYYEIGEIYLRRKSINEAKHTFKKAEQYAKKTNPELLKMIKNKRQELE